MIVSNARQLTEAVLAEIDRAPDTRLREILRAAVTHLHGFVRDARLTEAEFQQACAVIARLGQLTNESHNEVVLACGSLGVSSLVCLLNNGDDGQTETTANLLGPFWRQGSPATPSGGSIVRSPVAGDAIYVQAFVRDREGRPVEGAEVDVWQCSSEGFYENQDPDQADMNLRGAFVTDARGRVAFTSIKPVGYPIPVGGPVGTMLKALGRHNLRPAHLHFMIRKAGFKTQCSQVYSGDDPNLETDVQFGVTRALIGHYVKHRDEPPPWGGASPTPTWWSLDHHFVVDAGESRVPRPPITGKAAGPRPQRTVLERRPD